MEDEKVELGQDDMVIEGGVERMQRVGMGMQGGEW